MKGIIRYTDNSNVDLFGFVLDTKKIFGRPYEGVKQLDELLKLAKKEHKTVLSY